MLSHEHLSSTLLVCHPCSGDITKVLANPGMVPRWKKGTSTAVKQVVRNCCREEVADYSLFAGAAALGGQGGATALPIILSGGRGPPKRSSTI